MPVWRLMFSYVAWVRGSLSHLGCLSHVKLLLGKTSWKSDEFHTEIIYSNVKKAIFMHFIYDVMMYHTEGTLYFYDCVHCIVLYYRSSEEALSWILLDNA